MGQRLDGLDPLVKDDEDHHEDEEAEPDRDRHLGGAPCLLLLKPVARIDALEDERHRPRELDAEHVDQEEQECAHGLDEVPVAQEQAGRDQGWQQRHRDHDPH